MKAERPAWHGRTVVCIASGPSLTAADVDAVRTLNAPTIVTNTTFRLAPWADVLFGFDFKWWAAHFDEVRAVFGRGTLLSGSPLTKQFGIASVRGAEWFRAPNNSGACAIALAVAGGARRVVLIGYDCSFAPNGLKHWHGEHPAGLTNCKSLPNWPRAFRHVSERAKAAGVEVVNCTRRTALECFPRRALEDVLAEEREREKDRMKTIRSGKGLGDAIYLHAIVRHLVGKGQRLRVATSWPDLFAPFGKAVECIPFTRAGIDILAHYSRRKSKPGTDQFVDCCHEAGIIEPVPLCLDWNISDSALVADLRAKAGGRPIVLVQLPRAPMGRTDGFGLELLPDCRAIQRAIDRLRGRVLLVQIGAGAPMARFKGIDVDLADRTTVPQLLDVASICDGVLGYVSFILPLAESLSKPALLVWSRRGLKSATPYVRQITPAKVVHRKDLVATVLDGATDGIEGAADAFLR